MIYVRITEGLGNQLFKYACAFAVSQKTKDHIEIDLSGYAFRPRGYMLDKMNITGRVGDFPFPKSDRKINRAITKLRKIVKINLDGKCKIITESKDTQMKFGQYDFSYKRNIYIDGYWQNPRYFNSYKQELLKEFTPKPNAMSAKAIEYKMLLSSENSVAIHIRHGDYSRDWILSEEYYLNAVGLIKQKIMNPVIYVFCEDIEYAKEFCRIIGTGIVVGTVSKFSDIEEFFLMSSCSHLIIANSTFSWWAAYLNQNPHSIIIAPQYKQWAGDYYPDSWIKLEAKGVVEDNDESQS